MILNTAGVPRRPNLSKLESLANPDWGIIRPEETWHEGIRSLPPATWMCVRETGERRGTYWRPDIRNDVASGSPQAAYDELRGRFLSAVHDRLERAACPGVLLSGGLDSSAVASAAARRLSLQNRELPALCAVLPENAGAGLRDERSFIEEFRAVPNVRIHYIESPPGGPFDGIDNPADFDRLPFRSSRAYLYRAFERVCDARGIDVLLEGAFGEMSATDWAAGYLAELLVRGRWLKLAGELRARSRRILKPAWPILKRELSLGFFRFAMAKPFFLMNPAFGRHRVFNRRRFRLPDHRRDVLWRVNRYLNTHALRACSPAWRFDVREPFTDRRLLDFCLSAPGHLKVRDGYQRYMIRSAMADMVPSRILWRTDKIPVNLDYSLRHDAQLGAAREFVRSISLNDPVRSVVDVNLLESLIRPVANGAIGWPALNQVPQTIYLICFLRQFSEFRR